MPLLRTIEFLKDPLAGVTANVRNFGRVYRVNNFGGWNVGLIGPEANELVLFDKDRNFSSKMGWDPILDRVFPRGLMLMDFDHHRADRKTLGVAFKPEPMRIYLAALNDGIARGIAAFPATEFKFYPAIKQLTLDLAASSFLGIPWGPEADKINQSFVDMVAASIGIVRLPIPGTAMARGVRGRKFMCKFFAREIPKRRGAAGDDIFTQVCNARNDAGTLLSDQEIIDHMNFLMMAAHDTLTSSLTSTVYFLGKNPEWQDRLRAEILSIRATAGPELPYDRLGELEQVEWAFKEALRLLPPVPSVPRRALRDFEFGGYKIPAGTHVGVNPMYTHRMPEYWDEPETFDPSRFSHNPLERPSQIRLGAVRRRRAYVPRAALRLHAGQGVLLHAARRAPHRDRRRLRLRFPDVPDPQAQGRSAGSHRAAVMRRWAGWLALLCGALVLLWLVARVPDIDVATLRAKYGTPPSQFVEVVPGLTVHLRDEGPRGAPVLMLLHGSNASLLDWQPWTDQLKRRYRIVRFDLPAPRPDRSRPAQRL